MKRIFAAMLTALMLVTFLPLASPPARAAGITFSVHCSVDTAQPAYVGEEIRWWIDDVTWGNGPYEYAFYVYKNGQLISGEEWQNWNGRVYQFPSPGKYKVEAWIKDDGDGGQLYSEFSDEITVKENPIKITKVEPLGATSLRITWNTVPDVINYSLWRSTDMKNWEWIKTFLTSTSFTNTNLKPGTRYFYNVSFFRRGVLSFELNPPVAGVPMAKTRITSITSPSARRIRMTWAYAEGASGYQVAMATSANGNYKTVRIVTGGTTAIFSGVKSGTSLYFKVRPYRRVYTTTYWGQYSAYRAVKVK